MVSPQDWIHKLEEGGGLRYVRLAAVWLGLALLVVGANWRLYRNMNCLEAMDSAQVARNVSEGRGFKTQLIRPFSIYLLKRHAQAQSDTSATATVESASDPAQLREFHPDLANPPLYPLMLAGWMKIYPSFVTAAEGIRSVSPGFITRKLPHFGMELDNAPWTKNDQFWWHPHDFLISLLNQGLFLLTVWLTYRLALKLFDLTVARLSAVLLLACELLWRFSMSGLSTMLLLLIFTGLVWCLVHFESETREPKGASSRLPMLAALAGLLTALGMLTRYSFGWVIIPVLLFIGIFSGQRRISTIVAAILAFLVVCSPWIYRNITVSGAAFGTSGYAIFDGAAFAQHRLARSLDPNFDFNSMMAVIRKLILNSRTVLLEDLPRLAGGWATPFFIVGVMFGLRSPAIRRLRYLLLMVLGVLICAQALGRTQLSADSPDYNSENLLVLLVPLIVVFGVSFFLILLDQLTLPLQQLRYAVVGAFAVIVSLPMIYSCMPGTRLSPSSFPPYFPPLIAETSAWMKENELMMSDLPWAVAWYGNRQCVWLTLNAQDDFFAINDYMKPIRGLYLSAQAMDGRFVSDWVLGGDKSWGIFAIDAMLRQQIPVNFPLRKLPAGLLPRQMFLSDVERWRLSEKDLNTTPDVPKQSTNSVTNAQ